MEELFRKVIENIRTILNERFQGIPTEEFLNLANETKEKFKNNFQSANSLSVHDSLRIDQIFDAFIENL
jgi:hypothetical protein